MPISTLTISSNRCSTNPLHQPIRTSLPHQSRALVPSQFHLSATQTTPTLHLSRTRKSPEWATTINILNHRLIRIIIPSTRNPRTPHSTSNLLCLHPCPTPPRRRPRAPISPFLHPMRIRHTNELDQLIITTANQTTRNQSTISRPPTGPSPSSTPRSLLHPHRQPSAMPMERTAATSTTRRVGTRT